MEFEPWVDLHTRTPQLLLCTCGALILDGFFFFFLASTWKTEENRKACDMRRRETKKKQKIKGYGTCLSAVRITNSRSVWGVVVWIMTRKQGSSQTNSNQRRKKKKLSFFSFTVLRLNRVVVYLFVLWSTTITTTWAGTADFCPSLVYEKKCICGRLLSGLHSTFL